MAGIKKRQLLCAIASALWLMMVLPVPGQPIDGNERLDGLFAQLAEPGRDDWQQVEREITAIWAKSGSDAMDLLLERGNAALKEQNYDLALEHFTALTDHAPDFAEGWNARATTFFLMGEYSLSIADVSRVLVLNPRHFGALAGLGYMLEDMGERELALEALLAVQALNPNRPNINALIERLQSETGAAEL